MKISNEEKAREICGCNNCYHNLKENECLKDNRILCCLKPCLKNALEAMQWKENQIIEWLWNNFNIHIHDSSVIQGTFNNSFESFNDFIEFMKKDLEES